MPGKQVNETIMIYPVKGTYDTLPISRGTRKKSKSPGTTTRYKGKIWSFSDGVIGIMSYT
jgi:hypothetical protein